MKPQTQVSGSLSIDTTRLVFLSTSSAPVVGVATGEVVGWVCLPMVVVQPKSAPLTYTASPMVGTHIAARMQRLEQIPKRAASLAKARERLGKSLEATGDHRIGLAALRLQAGLSQHALAERMGTQQANISRWEASAVDLQASSIHRLAKVLGVPPAVVLSAVHVPEQGESNG